MSEVPAARLATVVKALVRANTTGAPPPRGLPYLGLESTSGTGLHLLEALSARGIFRKYELVLDVGTGLGGTARWLAARLGCEVVGVSADPAEAAAAAELTRRAGLATQVRTLAAREAALPVRCRFTHVWIIEALARAPEPARALAEAHDALRPGGMLAVQEIVAEPRRAAPAIAGWRFSTEAELVAQVRGAGLVELEVRDRTREAAERAARVSAARAQLLARIADDRLLAPIAAARTALGGALASGSVRVVQLLARRP